jgi:iron transport multicopper oxidase
MASVGNCDSDYFCSAFKSTLINGKGRYPGGPSDPPLAIVNVQHGLRSVFYPFNVWVNYDFALHQLPIPLDFHLLRP